MRRLLLATFLLLTISSYASELSNEEITELSHKMFSVFGEEKSIYIDKLATLEDQSLIPTFVLAMRWTGSHVDVASVLSDLTGEKITTWHEAYQWQERHPEIVPHDTYRELKLRILAHGDDRFPGLFEPPYGTPEHMRIRLEEIVWGGALYDDIASLDNTKMISATRADYLLEEDLVFGIKINGDTRAYPLRIMGWHEMVNDVVGGVPVALAYCSLCGSGILYETLIDGHDTPIVFGSSGLLYRSNKLMLDRGTTSLWNQYTGEPVVGPLAHSGIKLNTLPITITSWNNWRSSNPNTTVLSLNTGHRHNYDSGYVYKKYFASPDLMFPAVVGDESHIARKEYIFGIRGLAASKAWPLDVFTGQPVINDKVGSQSLVLIGEPETRTVRAYNRQPDELFEPFAPNILATDETNWSIKEDFLVSSDGKHKRGRVAGHISYWFAWDNFIGLQSELYEPK